MDRKFFKLISKSAAVTGMVLLMSNYVVAPEDQTGQSENLYGCSYKQIEPDIVLKEWQGLYKYEKANILPDQKAKIFPFPIARVSGSDSTMVVYIEPISIEVSLSENSLLGHKIDLDLPKDERLN